MLLEECSLDPSTTESNLSHVRNSLSAQWTIIYQVSDIVVFFALSALPLWLDVGLDQVTIGGCPSN